MSAAMERLILQSDWDHALKEPDGKAWISYKVQDKPTVHGELTGKGLSGEGIPYIESSEGFSVQAVHNKTLTATYTDEQACCTRQFVAPVATFNDIHRRRKFLYCLDVTAGGLAVSSDSERKLKIWETHSGVVRRNLDGHAGDVYTCRFFPSGIVALTGGSDMILKVWSAETGVCAAVLRGHTGGILDTAVIDKGRNVVSCSKDGTAKLWDVGAKKCLITLPKCGGNVNCVALENTGAQIELGQPEVPATEREVGTQGKLLLLGCETKLLQAYGLNSRKKVFELYCHDAVNTCCFLSDVCIACGTQDGHITVTDIRNIREPVQEWKESRSAILSFLPYGGGFFTSTGDGSCYYTNSSYETTVEFTGSDCDPIYKVVTDGKFLYTACRDSLIRKYKNISGLS